jgi:hypothetical protein
MSIAPGDDIGMETHENTINLFGWKKELGKRSMVKALMICLTA